MAVRVGTWSAGAAGAVLRGLGSELEEVRGAGVARGNGRAGTVALRLAGEDRGAIDRRRGTNAVAVDHVRRNALPGLQPRRADLGEDVMCTIRLRQIIGVAADDSVVAGYCDRLPEEVAVREVNRGQDLCLRPSRTSILVYEGDSATWRGVGVVSCPDKNGIGVGSDRNPVVLKYARIRRGEFLGLRPLRPLPLVDVHSSNVGGAAIV